MLGRSLLHKASREGNMNLVRTFICKFNADVTARDDNNTPLHVAALHKKEEVVLATISIRDLSLPWSDELQVD